MNDKYGERPAKKREENRQTALRYDDFQEFLDGFLLKTINY